jgi:hypothetical protein
LTLEKLESWRNVAIATWDSQLGKGKEGTTCQQLFLLPFRILMGPPIMLAGGRGTWAEKGGEWSGLWICFLIFLFYSYVHTMFGLFLSPSPTPSLTPCSLPLPPTPLLPSRNYFALISNFVEERV